MQSSKGISMMEALKLSKPEWNTDKMQVMSVFKWNEMQDEPKLYKHKDFIAVLLGNDKGLGFLNKPGVPSDLYDNELKGYDLTLFGVEEGKPDSFVFFPSAKADGNR
jgi:hypothetical protein